MARTVIVNRKFRCTSDAAHEFYATVESSDANSSTYRAYRRASDNGDSKYYATEQPSMPFPYCSDCGFVAVDADLRASRVNAQVADSEASAIAIHPVTGEVSYCFDRPDREMPALYRDQGYVKVQHKSYRDLERFCRSRGVVNDIETDRDGGYESESEFVEARRRHRDRVDSAVRANIADREEMRRRGRTP
jgi:hypothetical protein